MQLYLLKINGRCSIALTRCSLLLGAAQNGNIPVPSEGPIANGNAAAPIAATIQGVAATGTVQTAGAGRRRRMQTTAPINVGGANGAGYREPPLEIEIGQEMPIEWTAQVCAAALATISVGSAVT